MTPYYFLCLLLAQLSLWLSHTVRPMFPIRVLWGAAKLRASHELIRHFDSVTMLLLMDMGRQFPDLGDVE